MRRCAYCNGPLPNGTHKAALCCSVACADRLASAASRVLASRQPEATRRVWLRRLWRLRG